MYIKLEYKKIALILSVIFILTVPIFSINSKAQTTQSLYLNRVGFIDIEVGYDVHVVGDYAYVTNNDGLVIVNVENPRSSEIEGEFLCNGATGFVVENNIAYIACIGSGFLIVNLSDPTHPELIGQDIVAGPNEVAILGTNAYVSYFGAGFKIFNISDLTSPIPLGQYIDTRSDAIEIKGNYVYHANAEDGLNVVNVSNTNTPQFIASISQTGGANDIYITDNLLFLACWGFGIKVIDISDPTSPQILDSYDDDDGGEELGLIERDNLLYVADNYRIELFNVSNSNSIVKIAERSSDVTAAHDIDVDENYIYVAQGGGLLILEISITPENGIPGYLFYSIILSVFTTIIVISSIIYFKLVRPKNIIKEKT